MNEHIMANVYEAQRLAKELRRAIAAALWEIADDAAQLKRVLSIRDRAEDERDLSWLEKATGHFTEAMEDLVNVAESLDDIHEEAH